MVRQESGQWKKEEPQKDLIKRRMRRWIESLQNAREELNDLTRIELLVYKAKDVAKIQSSIAKFMNIRF